jgi:hypothetical protein
MSKTISEILKERAANLGVTFTQNDRKIIEHLREATIDVDAFSFSKLVSWDIADFLRRLAPNANIGRIRGEIYNAEIKVTGDLSYNNKTRSMRRQYLLDCIIANDVLSLVI